MHAYIHVYIYTCMQSFKEEKKTFNVEHASLTIMLAIELLDHSVFTFSKQHYIISFLKIYLFSML